MTAKQSQVLVASGGTFRQISACQGGRNIFFGIVVPKFCKLAIKHIIYSY